MNREEFIEKIKDCDFETFHVDGRHADFVVQDDSGQAWMIEQADYFEEDICATACAYIQDNKWAKPVKAFPVYGLCGYELRPDAETDKNKAALYRALDQIGVAIALIHVGNTDQSAALLRQASMTLQNCQKKKKKENE